MRHVCYRMLQTIWEFDYRNYTTSSHILGMHLHGNVEAAYDNNRRTFKTAFSKFVWSSPLYLLHFNWATDLVLLWQTNQGKRSGLVPKHVLFSLLSQRIFSYLSVRDLKEDDL